jgi:enolase-phosphatase E1
MKAIVTDIEGTTSSIAFVKEVLFPHARAHLPGFVRRRAGRPDVAALLDETRALAGDARLDVEGAIGVLLGWIDEDRKAPPLKALQGLIWEEGYREGAYRAHVYPDVPGALRRWKERGLGLAVFSSGSVLAQRLLFAHTSEGDLTPLFDRYFDTTTGPKMDPASYAAITAALGAAPAEVLFLSDVAAELDAAAAAGMARVGLAREGAATPAGHVWVESFDAIAIDDDGARAR